MKEDIKYIIKRKDHGMNLWSIHFKDNSEIGLVFHPAVYFQKHSHIQGSLRNKFYGKWWSSPKEAFKYILSLRTEFGSYVTEDGLEIIFCDPDLNPLLT